MNPENNLLSSSKEIDSWITFFLNYLSPYLSENDFALFQKRWHSYWKLFQLWKTKKLENEEIKDTVKQLISSKKSLSSLIRKYQQKEVIDNFFLSGELEKIWNAELAEKYLAKPQKVRNFLLGQIKKQFPKLDIRKISETVNEFIEKNV